MRKEREPNRREFLKNVAQGIAGLAGMGLLIRNEKIDRQQEKAIRDNTRKLNTVGEYIVADFQLSEMGFRNDDALLAGLNFLAELPEEERKKGEFVVEEGNLIWRKNE